MRLPSRAARGIDRFSWRKAARLALAVGVLMLGLYAARAVLASAARARSIDRALAFNPRDARLLALRAEALLATNDPADRAEADALARRAFSRDGTSASALVTLGLVRQFNGDRAAADRLITLAERWSRREYRGQLWLLEDAVQGDDVRSALRHYDVALRTSRDAAGRLFPILMAASADKELRPEIARLAGQQAIWTPSFLAYVAQNDPNVEGMAATLDAARRAGATLTDGVLAIAADRLVARSHVEIAWSLVSRARPVTSQRPVRDPAFRSALSLPSVFDWRLTNDVDISTSIPSGGGVDFASTGAGGIVVRQLLLLPAGTYTLRQTSRDVRATEGEAPYWVVMCFDGRQVAKASLKAGDGQSTTLTSVVVPATCAAQWIQLVAPPADETNQTSGTVLFADMTRTR